MLNTHRFLGYGMRLLLALHFMLQGVLVYYLIA